MIEQHPSTVRLSSVAQPVPDEQVSPRRSMIISWLVFALLFLAGAWHKPFSTHDFYSWVYAERCSVAEILTLKDTGIGHPPLYHLIQKGVQTVAPVCHPLNVRLANFLFGSIYVLVFSSLLGRRPGFTLFCCGIAASATTLDTFMLSRMWGLVCLLSLLLIVTGERLRHRLSIRDVTIFIALLALGFCSDYNFVLLFPYAALVILARGRWGHHLAHFILAGAGFIFIFLRWNHALKVNNPGEVVYLLLSDIFSTSMVGGCMLFNFWFEETYLLAMVIFIFCLALGEFRASREPHPTGSRTIQRLMLVSLFIVLFCGTLIRIDLIRIRHAWIPFLAILLLAAWSRRRYPFFNHQLPEDSYLAGIIGGLALLLGISPYLWTGLVQIRFFLVLFPLLLLLLAGRLPREALQGLAVLMILSGLVYTASSGLFLYYPPAAVTGTEPVIHADLYSYSDQYFHRDVQAGDEPYIIDQQNFVTSCRVCRMGTDRVPWQQFHRFRVVGPANKDPRILVPEQFQMLGEEIHISPLDRLQFGILSPIYPQRYAVSYFQRIESSNEVP